jgi:LysM repeat protein
MTKRSSASARALAVVALILGFALLFVVVTSALDDGGSGGVGRHAAGGGSGTSREAPSGKPAPATYVVKSGDTLTSIAHRTGVSVARIESLNPGVDPQILISGEKLKLR